MARIRTAVLISGRGSNLLALLRACAEPGFPAEIVLVLSNQPDAPGLAHAESYGVPTAAIDHRGYADRDAFERAMDEPLERAQVELICLAGFMRLLTPAFVERWWDRILNMHPALLPAFRGLDTHRRAIRAGVRFAGCTVHFIRPAMDEGPIVVQAAVPVLPDDTEDTLAARVLEVEHRCYPLALRLVADGRASVDGDVVRISGLAPAETATLNPPEPGERT
jgi:phosphoribosylglycinamide formyltransferase-1